MDYRSKYLKYKSKYLYFKKYSQHGGDNGDDIQPIHTFRHDNNVVNNAQFNQEGNLIVTASWDWTAKVWDLDNIDPNNPQPRYTFRHDHEVKNAQFNQKGNLIVTASWDTAKVWDIFTGPTVKSASKR